MANNKGYTLVEMLIVISIMVILASLSMFSIGVIRDAKRSAAVNTFDNEISTCLIKTKAVAQVDSSQNSNVCMYIYRRDNGVKANYCIKVGYDSGSDSVADIIDSSVVLGNSYATAVNDDANWDAVLPKDVADIIYTSSSGGSSVSITNFHKIKFRKSDGKVTDGYGEYEFVKADGSVYSTIYLDEQSGNHYIK